MRPVDESGATVSVIIPTYDRAQPCQRAVESALAQTQRPFEVIVVEDGSTSGIERWVRARNADNLMYLRHDSNRGLSAARNTGLQAAAGEYAAFLDDDDEWAPDKLEAQLAVAAASDQGAIVYCGAEVYSDSMHLLGVNAPRLIGDLREAIGDAGLYSVPSSVLIRAQGLRDLGGFDETLASHVDHDFLLTLASAGFAACAVDRPLVRTVEHRGPRMTRDAAARLSETDRLFEKWQSRLVQWYGRDRAIELRRSEVARVCGTVMADLIRAGRLRAALGFLGQARGHSAGTSIVSLALLRTLRLLATRSAAWHALKGAGRPS